MTWHLKDKELEKKLIDIDSEFSEKLNKKCEWIENDHNGNFLLKHIPFSFDIHNEEIRIFLTTRDVEKYPDYNPNDWNEFPTVKPPTNIWMRIESKDGWGAKAKWTGSSWLDCNKWVLIEKEYRFRPWED